MVKPRGLLLHARLLSTALRVPLRAMARWRVFRVEVVNRERIPEKGAVIVACNHLSVSDPIFLWGALRRTAVALAKSELWRNPLLGPVVWTMGQIPVDRGNPAAAQRALWRGRRVLEHKGVLVIFPEGKCSKDGELLPLKSGVADLAFATGAPVVPVGIHGSNGVKPLGSWRIRRRHPVRLAFGEAMSPGQYTQDAAGKQRFLDELARRIRDLSQPSQ